MKLVSQLYLDLLYLSIGNRLVDWCIGIIYFKGNNMAKYVLTRLIFLHSVTSLIKTFDRFSYFLKTIIETILALKDETKAIFISYESYIFTSCIKFDSFM